MLRGPGQALCVGAAAAALGGCGAMQLPIGAPPIASVEARTLPNHKTFSFHDKEQYFTIPAGVTSLTVVVRGAAGGLVGGGLGARVYARVPVVPGETLAIFVGGIGKKGDGGFNGGGQGGWVNGPYNAGGGGGGASDIREGGDALSNRIVVAAGGGGQGARNGKSHGFGGGGGGLNGEGGEHGRRREGARAGHGGGGGTQTRGGPGGGGAFGIRYGDGSSGSAGDGGDGGRLPGSYYYLGGGGGGGGGGYYGGGGGGVGTGTLYNSSSTGGGGGGGGSSYVEPAAKDARMWSGWKNATGDGLIVLSWGSDTARGRSASGSYGDLIYAGAGDSNEVYMLTYPAGSLFGSFSPPGANVQGMCTDSGGNVYVISAASSTSSIVTKYAHGATQPTWTKDMAGYRAQSCAVNPLTGNLAIYTRNPAGHDEIAIYPKAGGGPAQYVMPHEREPAHYFAYNGQGPLYAGVLGKGRRWEIAEMRVTQRPHYTFLAVDKQIEVGQLQWVGSYFAASKGHVVYHLALSGSGITVIGKTVAAKKQTPSWIEDSNVLIGAYGNARDQLAFWHYPRGGNAFK